MYFSYLGATVLWGHVSLAMKLHPSAHLSELVLFDVDSNQRHAFITVTVQSFSHISTVPFQSCVNSITAQLLQGILIELLRHKKQLWHKRVPAEVHIYTYQTHIIQIVFPPSLWPQRWLAGFGILQCLRWHHALTFPRWPIAQKRVWLARWTHFQTIIKLIRRSPASTTE